MLALDRVICLNNATSERGREHAARLTDAFQRSASQYPVLPIATTSVTQLRDEFAALQITERDLLVVNGGDGTLQALLGLLIKAEQAPMIAALPGGSTNMSAYDLNDHRGFSACVKTLVGQLAGTIPAHLHERSVLRVTDAQEIRAGFFCGIGAIVEGIEYCHAQLYAGGAKRQEFTAGLAMLRAIWGVLRAHPPFAHSQPLALSAFSTEATVGGPASIQLNPTSGALVLAASTLQRLLVGARPHWGLEPGDLRFTLVERDQRGLWYRLPGLLGFPWWPRPLASAGYHSHNCERLELRLEGGYTIDGELFTPQTDRIELDVGCRFQFMRL